jgi:hypothetical protein
MRNKLLDMLESTCMVVVIIIIIIITTTTTTKAKQYVAIEQQNSPIILQTKSLHSSRWHLIYESFIFL